MEITENLILLVVENPLPIYIAAMDYTNENSIVYLVYTEAKNNMTDSKFFANSIKKTLKKKKPKLKIKLIPIDKSNNVNIIESAYGILNEIAHNSIGNDAQSIIFYYNGGTKVMCNNFYYTIKDFEEANEKFKGKIQYKYDYLSNLKAGRMGIKDICEIHGYNLLNENSEIISNEDIEIIKNAKLNKSNSNEKIEFHIMCLKNGKLSCSKLTQSKRKNECKYELFKLINDAQKIGGSVVEINLLLL